jgi:hypothetical protein
MEARHVTRIEMAGSVTLAVISFLYSIGMMKKFKTSEDELERKA